MPAIRTAARLLVPAMVAAALVPVLASSARAAPGDLDPTFGSGGTVVTAIGSDVDQAYALAVQPDGKIVAAGRTFNGSNNDFALIRYLPGGALDTGFGAGGKVVTPIGTEDVATAVALQSDGSIVAAGYAFTGGTYDFALARYTPTGVLDATFGSGGKVTTPIGSFEDVGNAVAIQGDGKIVAGGRSHNGSHHDFALARYTPTGALDTTFGTGGKVITNFASAHDVATAMAIQPDGKIVAAGYTEVSAFSHDFALARYTTTGALDSSFDFDGRVSTAIGSADDAAFALALQPNGKIVAAGQTFGSFNYDFGLVRYMPNGALDQEFGGGGKLTTAFGSMDDVALGVAIQPDGNIVAAGHSVVGCGCDFDNFALARYDSTGTLDITFDSDGRVTTSIVTGFPSDAARAVAIQDDGKLVAAGSANGDFALARYLADPPSVSVSDASVTEGDSGTANATFTVSLLGAGPSDYAKVHYSTASDSAGSADFVPTDGTLTFKPGQVAKSVTVPVKGDLIDELDETFYFVLSSPVNVSLEDAQGIGTIVDNDPTPAISVGDAGVTEGNSGTTYVTFALSLSNPSSEAITVDFETSDGTATAPADYGSKSGTRVFLPGQVTKTVSVAVKGETAQEPDETFLLNLLDPSVATLGDGQGVATIVDDDRPTISITDVSKTEVDSGQTTTYTFKVTLSKAGTGTITVQYATQDGTAVAPGDYTAKSGTLSFSPGTVSKNVTVTVKGDAAMEPDEFFLVNLSNATGATIADPSGVGTIVNDD